VRIYVASLDSGSRSVLRLHNAAGVEERVRAWAALEAECCPFLMMVVDAAEAVVALRIDGPPEAAGIIDELLPVDPRGRSRWPPNGGPANRLPWLALRLLGRARIGIEPRGAHRDVEQRQHAKLHPQ
jgi:hypothetical protein